MTGFSVLLLRPHLGSEAKKLKTLGARVIHSPVLSLIPLYPYTLIPSSFDWIVFTSSTAVRFFKKRFRRLPASSKIAAIGPQTAQAVSKFFKRKIDFMPSAYTTEALAKELPLGTGAARPAAPVPNILLIRSEIADKRLEAILKRRRATFKRVSPYTVKEKSLKAQAKRDLLAGKINYVFFGSASQVRSFSRNFTARDLKRIFKTTLVLAIGPETSKALEKLAIPHKTSPRHTFDGLIDLLCDLKKK